MKSVKGKLVLALSLVELVTLGMALALYVGASQFDDDARSTRQANDDLRQLLDFSLMAHAYMDAFGRSLGQRTLIANRERRVAAAAFDRRIADIPRADGATRGLHALGWQELQSISTELSAGLRVADAFRARGDFEEAERRFAEARRSDFDGRMLPWFLGAIASLRADATAREADSFASAARLRLTAVVLASVSPILALLAVLWISGSVVRPVRALVAGAEAIGRGDLAYRLRPAGRDEFAVVSESFNRMVETIAATQSSLLEQNVKLEEAYRMQGEFISVVTHELRSPLHSIRGYLEFIEEDEPGLSKMSQRNLANIGEGSKRLLRLVDDILDYSKLEAKQLEAVTSRFELAPLLEDAFADARALVRGRPLELVQDWPPEPLFVESDDVRLRQILTNLLSNAVKFTESGRVTLAANVARERVELAVRDTGIGIPEGQLGLIFQPFRQAASALGRASGGTGLGLAIVARLAELIGAKVSVRSELGKGSEFCVSVLRGHEDGAWRPS